MTEVIGIVTALATTGKNMKEVKILAVQDYGNISTNVPNYQRS
jgi:hypothetical protein